MLSLLALYFGFSHFPTNMTWLPFVFLKKIHVNCSVELSSLGPQLHESKRITGLAIRSHRFTVETLDETL